MCTLITAIVPSATVLQPLRQLCEKHGFNCDPMDNASLRTILPDGYQFMPIGGSCNCSTPLGSALSPSFQPHDLEADISKLRKKGWSAAKIERWKQAKERAPQQKKERQEAELMRWENWIRDVLKSHAAQTFALVLHFYNGGIDTDPIQIKRTEIIRIQALNADKLAHLDWDVLYQFSEK